LENTLRKIIHIDMDAFFASVEQRDYPTLRGKPVAVGGSEERGVVAAASYEARKFGVRSAMGSRMAKRLCPNLIFVPPRFEQYKEVSGQIRAIFHAYTDLVEPLSLDEAYLDVTENFMNIPLATEIAKQIRIKIEKATSLTASAGISFNKFLAKTASDVNKPNGMFVIKPHQAEMFIGELPIKRFYGVGKVTADKMTKMGISSGKDLKEKSLEFLVNNFGKVGRYYFDIARGVDNRNVNPDRIRKSIGVENTFNTDLFGQDEIFKEIDIILEQLWKRIKRANVYGKTLTLKMKYADFEIISRSKTSQLLLTDEKHVAQIAYEMLNLLLPAVKGIRLMGLTISNLETETDPQLTLKFSNF
jgi:DNA polymerase-4